MEVHRRCFPKKTFVHRGFAHDCWSLYWRVLLLRGQLSLMNNLSRTLPLSTVKGAALGTLPGCQSELGGVTMTHILAMGVNRYGPLFLMGVKGH